MSVISLEFLVHLLNWTLVNEGNCSVVWIPRGYMSISMILEILSSKESVSGVGFCNLFPSKVDFFLVGLILHL